MMLIPKVFAQDADALVESSNKLMPVCPETGCGWNEFVILINNLIGLLMKIVPFVAIFWIIYGGFQIMTAGGDTGKYNKGKTKIVGAIIGLVLVYSSYLIYNLIIGVFAR
jgi:hypothetical protein